MAAQARPPTILAVGTRVEVRTRYNDWWSRGFEVVEATDDGYWLRRESDDYLLPRPFRAHEIRRRG